MKEFLTKDDMENIKAECEVLEGQINSLENAVLSADSDMTSLNKIGLSAGKVSGSVRKLFFHIGVFEPDSDE